MLIFSISNLPVCKIHVHWCTVYKICRSIFVHVCTKIFESLCRVVHYQKDLLINFCAGICAILCRNLCHFCADLCTIRNCAENCALSEKINLFYNTNINIIIIIIIFLLCNIYSYLIVHNLFIKFVHHI